MKRALTRIEIAKITGWHKGLTGTPNPALRGDVSGLSGDVSGLWGYVSGLWGNVSGLRGDVSGLRGDVSGLSGDVNDCELTADDRQKGVSVIDLISGP